MLNSTFGISKTEELNLLFLGAHCDDIEIGCGGTMLKLIENYAINHIQWVVFTSNETRKEEAFASAAKFLEKVENSEIKILEFKDGYLPSVWSKIKDEFEELKEKLTPDIIFTHYREDLHQDHRIVNELTWNTFRNHLICEYEIPKYDGDLGKPNLFVPLHEDQAIKKKEIILDNFQSQLNKQWLDDSLLSSLLRIRGVECAAESNYAEAFYCRKITF